MCVHACNMVLQLLVTNQSDVSVDDELCITRRRVGSTLQYHLLLRLGKEILRGPDCRCWRRSIVKDRLVEE